MSPVSPFHADGSRTEPPVSVPTAQGTQRAATLTPDPELLPPGARCTARSQGFHGVPMCRLVPHEPIANSTVRVLPMTIRPASTSRRASVAVRGETRDSQTFEPPVVTRPSMSMMSLSAIGTPVEPPRPLPGTPGEIGLPGGGPRIGRVHGDKGAKPGLEPLDPGEQRLHELFRGEFTRRQRIGGGVCGQEFAVLHCHSSSVDVARSNGRSESLQVQNSLRAPHARRCASIERQKCMSNLDLLSTRSA